VDGGATWQVQLLTPGVEYFGSQAVDAQNAWVAGNPGVILRTRDGGKTWERQALPDGVPADVNLGPIVAVDGMHAWTNGESKSSGRNYWLHTVDGATWQITPIDSSLPITVGFQDMSAVDATHVWGAGTIPGTNREGGVVGFFDGQKWTRQAAGEFKDMFGHTQIALIGINAYDATHAWVVGGVETAVYQTIDGTNWFTRSQSWIPTGDTNTVVMADTLHGWAGGDHGVLYYTTDNWATFEKQGQFDGTFATISAKDANTAWATTYTQMVATGEREEPRGGRIVRTCDGGQTWEKQVPLEGYEFINISFVGARR
jgi:photosystem II stability/assembly factor-like uncharacterized protein